MEIGILNKGTMISYEIESMFPIGWSKGYVIMKYVATIIHLVEFDKSFFELEYVIWSHKKHGIYNWRIWENLDKW